jgi:hypothetical protein
MHSVVLCSRSGRRLVRGSGIGRAWFRLRVAQPEWPWPDGDPDTFAIPARYFIDHDDVTSSVSLSAGGNGFTFRDMAPGETQRMTIRYNVDQNAPNGTVARNLVRLTSALDPLAQDLVVIEVQVQASTG